MGQILRETIAEIVKNYMEASSPSTFLYGTVVSESPLKIQVDDNKKLTLTSEFLVMTRNVQDHDVDMTFSMATDGGDGITSKNSMKIHNKLEKGDKVILIRQQGGQKYLVAEKY